MIKFDGIKTLLRTARPSPNFRALSKLIMQCGFASTPLYAFTVWFSSTLTCFPLTNRLTDTVQQLMVVHLLREHNFLLRKSKVYCRTQKTLPLFLVRSQSTRVHTLTLYLFQVHMNGIIPSRPCTSNLTFPFVFPTGILCIFHRCSSAQVFLL